MKHATSNVLTPDNDLCEYRNEGTLSDKDHHLDGRFLELLKPIFVQLSKKALLEKCIIDNTQSNLSKNESFHALI